MSDITLTANPDNLPRPVAEERVKDIITTMTENQAKAANYWQAVAAAIDELNARAKRRGR